MVKYITRITVTANQSFRKFPYWAEVFCYWEVKLFKPQKFCVCQFIVPMFTLFAYHETQRLISILIIQSHFFGQYPLNIGSWFVWVVPNIEQPPHHYLKKLDRKKVKVKSLDIVIMRYSESSIESKNFHWN